MIIVRYTTFLGIIGLLVAHYFKTRAISPPSLISLSLSLPFLLPLSLSCGVCVSAPMRMCVCVCVLSECYSCVYRSQKFASSHTQPSSVCLSIQISIYLPWQSFYPSTRCLLNHAKYPVSFQGF